jgi:hypothetical protein
LKILITDLVETATITADNPNVNYPAVNLASHFVGKKFKSLSYTDSVKILFDDEVSLDCLYYVYSNAEAMVARFYNSATELLDTLIIDCAGRTRNMKSGAEHFTKIDNVRWIEIDADAPVDEDLYIGKILTGLERSALPAPDFPGYETLAEKKVSQGGQVSEQNVRPLISMSLRFELFELGDYKGTMDETASTGRTFCAVDFTPDTHDKVEPMYATMKIGTPKRDGDLITMTIDFKEAR